MPSRALLPWALGAAGLGVFAWVLWRIDYTAFRSAVADTAIGFVILVPAAILFEQWLAAGKWKLFLAGLGGARLSRVFGANMAGFIAGYVVPAVGAPVVRSWLVARSEGLRSPSVLATIALDRIVDGAAFVAFAAAAILLVGLPEAGEFLRGGLIAGAASGAAILVIFVALLAVFRRRVVGGDEAPRRLAAWVPARWRAHASCALGALADGVVWPRSPGRMAAIVLLAVCVKALAVTHMLWAGLALGVPLGIPQYVLLMVLLGSVHLLARFVRIPGSFIFAAIFFLEMLGVDPERALAMALIVQVSAIVSVTAVGAAALAWLGVELRELKAVYAGGTSV